MREREEKEWKVYFSGNYREYDKRERAGEEIVVGKEFWWGEERWLVPAVYVCKPGLVMDFCVEIPRERLSAFREYMEKFHEKEEHTDEELEELEKESPLCISFRPEVKVNGSPLRFCQSCATAWNPCVEEEETVDEEARQFLLHYGCEESQGWGFIRAEFSWGVKEKSAFRRLFAARNQGKLPKAGLSLTMKREPVMIPGPHFTGEEPVTFKHPVTGTSHTLTVLGYKPQVLDEEVRGDDRWEWPGYFREMTYSLAPPLPREQFMVMDCKKSGQPKRKTDVDFLPQKGTGATADGASEDRSAAAIGIIGGADGPTAIFLAGKSEKRKDVPEGAETYLAWSSLQFEPAEHTEWRIAFRVKRFEDMTVEIL